MSNSKLHILVLDDDPVVRNLFRAILKEKSFVLAVDCPSAAYKALKDQNFDILFTDFRLPEENGIKVLSHVRQKYPDVNVIMISAEGDMNTVIGALRHGAVDYLRKPFTAIDIWAAVERTLKYGELTHNLDKANRRNEQLKLMNASGSVLQEIQGNNPQILEVKRQIKQVATTTDTSVLILGESGTGKELVARGIHHLSSRREEVFGAVNMSAVPESLFESEFFGHKKGSFTGAIADKAGWFEMADRGTLFFDEIGEMDVSQQVKLLRVLEDRKYIKIGTQKENRFDIRIIAATNKSVDEMSSGKHFRSDLYYRLSTFIIHMPPLRERLDDIPVLTDHFLKMFVQKMRKPIKRLHPEVYSILKTYHFPGNIRELKNLMERAVILCETESLNPDSFPDFIQKAYNPDYNSVIRESQMFDLKELEKSTIINALTKTGYNKNEAAGLLGIEWNALHRRMMKYGIQDIVNI